MRRLLTMTIVLACAAGPAARAQQSAPPKPDPKTEAKAPASVAGKWNMTVDMEQGPTTSVLTLKLDGKKVTGTAAGTNGEFPIEGEFADAKLKFSMAITTPNGTLQIAFSATLKDDGTLAGIMDFQGVQQIAWKAERVKEKEPVVTGKWAMILDMSMGQATPALVLTQDKAKITGTYTGRYGTYALTGTLTDRVIQFAFEMGGDGQAIAMSFTGEVAADGQTMKGKAVLGEELGAATWTATRDKSE
jgi:hypothetical protein